MFGQASTLSGDGQQCILSVVVQQQYFLKHARAEAQRSVVAVFLFEQK